MASDMPTVYDRRDVISGSHGYPEANTVSRTPQITAEIGVLRSAAEFNRKQMERLIPVIPQGPQPSNGSEGHKPHEVLCPLAQEIRAIRLLVEESNCILQRMEL